MNHPITELRRLLTAGISTRAIGVVSSISRDTACVTFGRDKKIVNISGLDVRVGDSILLEAGSVIAKVSKQDTLPVYHL